QSGFADGEKPPAKSTSSYEPLDTRLAALVASGVLDAQQPLFELRTVEASAGHRPFRDPPHRRSVARDRASEQTDGRTG
ncbi:hypothetical protein ABTF07_20995, partial [Acinetobacter baumannii]